MIRILQVRIFVILRIITSTFLRSCSQSSVSSFMKMSMLSCCGNEYVLSSGYDVAFIITDVVDKSNFADATVFVVILQSRKMV